MSIHQQRLNAEFTRALSECIRELRDPRIPLLTSVTRAELTGDLKHAKVYVSVYDNDAKKRDEAIDALSGASGTLSKLLGAAIKMRRIPALHFVLDDTIAYSVHISKVIDDIKKESAGEAEQADTESETERHE